MSDSTAAIADGEPSAAQPHPQRKRPSSKPPLPDRPLTRALIDVRRAPAGHRVKMPSGATYGVDPSGKQLWRLDKQRHLTKKQRRAARRAAKAAAK